MSTDPWAGTVRGLLLDVDDTLVDTRAAMEQAGIEAAAALWPGLTAEQRLAFSRRFYDDPGGFFDRYTSGAMTFEEQRESRFDRAVADLALPARDIVDFTAAYVEAFGRSQQVFEDGKRLLAAARAAGVGVVLLTNSGTSHTQDKLDRVGLTDCAPIVSTDTLGFGKPDPRVFAHASELLGLAAADIVVVGDTLPTDIAGARAAGMRAAWLCRPDTPAPRDSGWGTPIEDAGVRIVGSLDDVAGLLRRAPSTSAPS